MLSPAWRFLVSKVWSTMWKHWLFLAWSSVAQHLLLILLTNHHFNIARLFNTNKVVNQLSSGEWWCGSWYGRNLISQHITNDIYILCFSNISSAIVDVPHTEFVLHLIFWNQCNWITVMLTVIIFTVLIYTSSLQLMLSMMGVMVLVLLLFVL